MSDTRKLVEDTKVALWKASAEGATEAATGKAIGLALVALRELEKALQRADAIEDAARALLAADGMEQLEAAEQMLHRALSAEEPA